jgi:hypothetical protein
VTLARGDFADIKKEDGEEIGNLKRELSLSGF